MHPAHFDVAEPAFAVPNGSGPPARHADWIRPTGGAKFKVSSLAQWPPGDRTGGGGLHLRGHSNISIVIHMPNSEESPPQFLVVGAFPAS